MPVTIKINGTVNSLVHKTSNGISIATIPDVCKTPSPGGPVPIPYPNIAQSITLSNGTTTVKGDKMMAANKGSKFALSNGDNAGTIGGVKSNGFMKEATWITYSFNVKLQGKNACRFTDKMFHNAENTANLGGELQQPVAGSGGAQSSNAESPNDNTAKKSCKKADNSSKCKDGDPVNSVTGEVMLSQTDFTLSGRIPLTWTRNYGSQNEYTGRLGPGWQSPADARLEIDADGIVTFYDGHPGGAVFEKLPQGEPVMEAADGAVLSRAEDQYQLKLKSGLTYHFLKTFTNHCSRVVRISDENGQNLDFRYKDGVLHQIADTSGQTIQVTTQGGRILAMHLNNKPLVRYAYEKDRLASATDALGHSKAYTYQKGRLVRHADKNNVAFNYTYDDSRRCTRVWGDKGLYDYRFDHRPYERSVKVTDSLGNQKTYLYNAHQQPLKEIDAIGAAISYEYDRVGRTINVTDHIDRSTEYIYDAAGNVIEIIPPDGNPITMTYDANNRPVQMIDPNGNQWAQRFDEKGRLIEKTNPLGATIQYSYNHWGDLETVTDPQGETIIFEYDEHGRVISVTDANSTTHYQRDSHGQITAVIDPEGRTTRYNYDKKSRLIQSILPSGSQQHFQWDPEDNLIVHTDPNGHKSRFEYGGLNEIVRRINADGTSVSYDYDTEENLIGVTNEKKQTHKFTYDHAGRVTTQTDYYRQTTRYTYDPAGQLIQTLDPLGRTIDFAYDENGRLLTKTFQNEEQEIFNWDPNGNLLAVQSPGALIERRYDAANNLTGERNGDFNVAYQYDQSGRRTQRTTRHGNTVKYGYDAAGAPAFIKINDQPPVAIERNKLGQITKEAFSQDLHRTYSYNEDGLLTHQSIKSATTRLDRHYAYDAAANLISKQDSSKGAWQFTHDPMGRITQSLDPENQTHKFTYDPAGDLLEHLEHQGQGPRSARYDNRLYQYDVVGNLTGRTHADNQHSHFTWDDQNRLKTVLKSDHTHVTMTYDALGRRLTKTVNGRKIEFNWDGDALLSEKHPEKPAREYVYYPGTFEPLAVIDGDGQVYYYQNDLNGLPCELTKPSGDIVWSATYDALGRIDKILVNEVEQPLRMQGQYWDQEIDLCYNRYRYFDPQICAFISQDPIGLAGGENVYAYGPNVWNWIDPLGLKCDESSKGIGKIHAYSPESLGQRSPHFSVETIGKTDMHTHQVVDIDTRLTTMDNATGLPKPSSTYTVELSDIDAAQRLQSSRMGDNLGKYNIRKNSCLTNACDILREGGADIPGPGKELIEWAQNVFK